MTRGPVTQNSGDREPARRVVMITSPGVESSLSDVALNLATISAETGQRVALLSTNGLASPAVDQEHQATPALPWRSRFSGRQVGSPSGSGPGQGVNGSLNSADVEELLEDSEVPGVSRLNLRHFVSHPVQVVIRMPEVLAALGEIVDVVILEVPSYLTVHHGEGLTPFVDVVLVVAERDATTMDQVRRTSAALKRLGAPVIGLALTSAETRDWDIDAGFGTDDGRLSGGFDRTEPLPIINPRGVTPAAPFDDRATVDRALPEA